MSNNNRGKLRFPNKKFGVEQRQNWVDEIAGYSGYLPDTINVKDIDTEFIKMVSNDLAPIVPMLRNGEVIKERVPALFMSTQAWNDYSKTWELKDNNKDLTYPFVIITRETDLKPGTIQNGYYNIPGRKNWIYLKVPNTSDGRDGVDIYKIPQPTAVDISYTIKMFASRLEEINLFNESIFRNYNSFQKYVVVKGHPMATKNEGGSDESELEIDEKIILINSFDITLQGYLINSDDFDLVRSIDRSNISLNLNKSKDIRK